MLPVKCQHCMAACTDMISHLPCSHWLVDGRQLVGCHSLHSIKRINRISVPSTKELSALVSPIILTGRGDIYSTWGTQGNSKVLIEGHALFAVAELQEIAIEPIGEVVVHTFHCFANLPIRESSTATTTVHRDGERETFVCSTCPQSSLAQTRMANHRHTAGIHLLVGLQIVYHTAGCPCPNLAP